MNTDLPNAERVHHPYSPSKLQSLEACPDYDSAFTESEAAATGTMQHNVAETGEDDLRLPDYKILAVAECMQFVAARQTHCPKGQTLKEVYLPVDEEVVVAQGQEFKGTTAGYVDVAIISEDQSTIEVIDFKFGQHAVEKASNNLQGIAYLLGLKKMFPNAVKGLAFFTMPHREETTGAEFDLVSGVALREYHSRTGWTNVPPGPPMYLRVKTVVARAVEAHKEPRTFAAARPTESACLFCSNLGKCPKVAELALKLGKKYRPLEIPESVSTAVFRDPKDLERGLKFAAVIKVWAEAFRTQATNKIIDDPKFVPVGYDIVTTSKRKVVDARKLAEEAKKFLPPEQHAAVEKLFDLSLGPLEKLISAAAARGMKEKTVQQFAEAAVEAKAVEEGQPFAFLRQSKSSGTE